MKVLEMNTVENILAKRETESHKKQCHIVFKGRLLQRQQKVFICWKALNTFQTEREIRPFCYK